MNITAGSGGEIWQAGDLIIDVGRQSVTRGQQALDLPKLSFDLLLALARGAPNVLSNEALMAQVWPRLVVSPETVVQRVKLLRAALGDDPDAPRYVAGLRGRGYRLVVEVVRQSSAVAATAITDATSIPAPANGPHASPPSAWWKRYGPHIAATMVAAGMLLAILVWYTRQYGVEAPLTDIAPPATGATARTVAVLPFRNLSADPDDAFIALGLPEVVLDRLAALPGLIVVARDSAFRAGERGGDPRDIGRRLNAGYLVDGSVQRQGEALRVPARLIETRSNLQVWSTRYERRIDELFALQDEIAGRVAKSLESRVTGVQASRAEPAPTADIEAYLAWLRGRTLIGRYTVAEALAAAAQFERAISRDPGFAAAYAALYDARMQAVALRLDDMDAARRRNRSLLDRAFALEPKSGAAHFARAMWEDLDNAAREADFRRGIELDPSNSRGLTAFSEFLDITDASSDASRVLGSGFSPGARESFGRSRLVNGSERAAEAAGLLERAITIDPLSARPRFRRIQRSFDTTGPVEVQMEGLLVIDPQYYPALQRMAVYRWLLHDSPAEAIAIVEKAIANDPQNPWARHTAVAFYLDVGDPAAAQEVAAATPASALTAAPVLALYAGDWRAAAQAAATDAGFIFGFHESWGSAEALRDAALRTRDFAAAERLLTARYNLSLEGPDHVTVRNYRSLVLLAHLQLAQGRRDRARQMLETVTTWIDADRRFGKPYMLRTRAEAQLLLDRPEQALRDLAASFQIDHDHMRWWYVLRLNPAWNPLRNDPRFRALDADAQAFVARERAKLEALRQRGEVPRRPAAAARTTGTGQ